RQIQSEQEHKPLDNEYMKTLNPSAKRWYEITVEDVFGVVKNGGLYGFEIKYSEYIKAHHTLSRQTGRRRLVMQMNKVIRDHISSKYIARVEYRPIKLPGQLIDCLIRYYPGDGAKESIKRIARAEKKIPGLMEVKPRKARRKKIPHPELFNFDFDAE